MGPITSTIPGPWGSSRATGPRRKIYTNTFCNRRPDAKIAILYQNDDFGRLPRRVKDVLGDKFDKMTVTASYETTAASDSQITSLQASEPRCCGRRDP